MLWPNLEHLFESDAQLRQEPLSALIYNAG